MTSTTGVYVVVIIIIIIIIVVVVVVVIIIRGSKLREPEVGDLGVSASVGEKYICWLEVVMNDAETVEVAESAAQLHADVDRPQGANVLLPLLVLVHLLHQLLDCFKQGSTFLLLRARHGAPKAAEKRHQASALDQLHDDARDWIAQRHVGGHC